MPEREIQVKSLAIRGGEAPQEQSLDREFVIEDHELRSRLTTAMPVLDKDDGVLAEAPLAALLADVHLRSRTGTLQIIGKSIATLVLADGYLHKVSVEGSPAYLGGVLYELGYIDSEMLDASLRDLSDREGLQGRLLLERGAIGPYQLETGLVEQMRRKVHALFEWSEEARWSFFDRADGLSDYGGNDWPSVDLRPSVWRGVREHAPRTHIARALAALGGDTFALTQKAHLGRYGFDDEVRAAAECLRVRPMSCDELASLGLVATELARHLFYTLALFGDLERKTRSVPMPVPLGPPSSPPLKLSGMRRRPSGAAAADPREDLQRKLADATRAYRRGELEQAESLCRRAHSIDPEHPEVLALLAWLEALKPENQTPADQAFRLEILQGAVAKAPRNPNVLFYRGSMYKRFGNMRLALRDFRAVLEIDRAHVDALREVRLHAIRQRRS
jgi:tetratricopeptide (TPR) repeat protein